MFIRIDVDVAEVEIYVLQELFTTRIAKLIAFMVLGLVISPGLRACCL